MSDRRLQNDRGGRRIDVVVRWVAVTIGVVATVAVTRTGLLVSPDSTRYLSGAESLMRGDGLLTPTGDPLVLFPPGTSIVYSIGELLPGTTLGWVRLVNAFMAGAAVLVTSSTISRQVRHRAVSAAASLFTGVSVGLLAVTRAAWSEPIHLVLVALFVRLLAADVSDPHRSRSRVLVLVAVVWAACLTRYAGFALIPVGAVAIVAFGRRRSLRRATAFAAAASAVPVAWLAVNWFRAGSLVGDRPPSIDTFPATVRRIIEVVGSWLLPTESAPDAGWVRFALGVGVGAILVATVVGGIRRTRVDRHDGVADPMVLAGVAGLTALAGMAMVGLTQLRTAIDPADARLLSSSLIPSIVAISVWVDGFGWASLPRPRWWIPGVVGAVALVLGVQTGGAGRIIDDPLPEPWAYNSSTWSASATVAAVDDLPDGAVVWTNDAYAVWALTDRRSIDETPRSGDYRSDLVTGFPADEDLGLSCDPTYLVWFDRAARFHHPVERIGESVDLSDRRDFADGEIHQVARPTGCG